MANTTATTHVNVPEPKIDTDEVRDRLLAIEEQLTDTFVAREHVVRVLMLSYLTRQHFLLVGDPGTAKTAVINAFNKHVEEAQTFSTLLGAFTTPEHIFGVLDIGAFKAGRYEYVTTKMLPEAHFATLDEVMKAGDGCLNALLTALNERTFQGESIPLHSVGSATNWPEVEAMNPNVHALYDRFLLRVPVQKLDTLEERKALFRAVKKVAAYVPEAKVTMAEIQAACDSVQRVKVSDAIYEVLHGVAHRLENNARKAACVRVSDRRLGQLLDTLQASAWLAGRDEVTVEDFEWLRYGLWNTREDIETVNTVINDIDAEEVAQLVRLIDRGRQAYRELSQGMGTAQVTEVLERMTKIGKEVRDRFNRPVFTENGGNRVREAMRGLKSDYRALMQRVQP